MNTNELHERLREADPLLHEPTLSDDESSALRDHVLSFHPGLPRRRLPGRRLVFVTALLMLGIAATGITRVGMRRPEIAQSTLPASTVYQPDTYQPVRRVYFETPSGMHVVWQFQLGSGEGTLP
jgi:hypothetical protein